MRNQIQQSLEREWERLRRSFERCGDIGEFNFDELISSKWLAGQYREGFISNVIGMDKKIPEQGYASQEALNVFTVIASLAGERLGLRGELASAFGVGYGFARTGLIAYYRLESRQILFHKMFFPLGGDSNWYFDSSTVKAKFRMILETFKDWQNDPQLYAQELNLLQNTRTLLQDWEETWQ